MGYLLQRMESYLGLAILTTNLKNSPDKAFTHLIELAVKFPFPKQQNGYREKASLKCVLSDALNFGRLAELG
jgi:hypothetical protein